MIVPNKSYLGDGCYVSFEYGEVVLTTHNGFEDTNRIVLDYGMVEELYRRMQQIINE